MLCGVTHDTSYHLEFTVRLGCGEEGALNMLYNVVILSGVLLFKD